MFDPVLPGGLELCAMVVRRTRSDDAEVDELKVALYGSLAVEAIRFVVAGVVRGLIGNLGPRGLVCPLEESIHDGAAPGHNLVSALGPKRKVTLMPLGCVCRHLDVELRGCVDGDEKIIKGLISCGSRHIENVAIVRNCPPCQHSKA